MNTESEEDFALSLAREAWNKIVDYADNCEDAIGDMRGDTVAQSFIHVAIGKADADAYNRGYHAALSAVKKDVEAQPIKIGGTMARKCQKCGARFLGTGMDDYCEKHREPSAQPQRGKHIDVEFPCEQPPATEHEFLFDVCQKCGVSAFNLDEGEPCLAQPPATDVRVHDLKAIQPYFDAVLSGKKTFEIRRNDRGFACGDQLLLREWDEATASYTGKEISREISYITDYEQKTGFVVMGLQQPTVQPAGAATDRVKEPSSHAVGQEWTPEDLRTAEQKRYYREVDLRIEERKPSDVYDGYNCFRRITIDEIPEHNAALAAAQQEAEQAITGWQREVLRADDAEAAVGENCWTIARLEKELTAEREKNRVLALSVFEKERQLAAEREERKKLEYTGCAGTEHTHIRNILNLEQQLGAEREVLRKAMEQVATYEQRLNELPESEVGRLREQLATVERELAAEREETLDAQRKLKITGDAYNALHDELLAAQAAIAECRKYKTRLLGPVQNVLESVDLSALKEHDAEVTDKALLKDIKLHSATRDLVIRFARAMADKLAAAEAKYGYTDGWQYFDADECREILIEHLRKGDPRDVANYCAFLWHQSASTKGE